MNSSQSIKALRPLKGGIMFHEDFDVSSNNAIQSESKLIHEHDFITTRIKETNSFFIHCITCGICYCGLCGKALEDNVINHECYNVSKNNSKWLPFFTFSLSSSSSW
jgi:hypothetical protein